MQVLRAYRISKVGQSGLFGPGSDGKSPLTGFLISDSLVQKWKLP